MKWKETLFGQEKEKKRNKKKRNKKKRNKKKRQYKWCKNETIATINHIL